MDEPRGVMVWALPGVVSARSGDVTAPAHNGIAVLDTTVDDEDELLGE